MSREKRHFMGRCGRVTLTACLAGIWLLFLCSFSWSERAEAATPQKEVFTYFTQTVGLKPAAACGIMANISAESGFKSGITGLGGAYGLCQWGGVRLTRLRSYCSSHGYSSASVAGQVHFILYEFQTYFPNVYNYLKNVPNTAQGAYNAAYHFCAYYEIPASRYSAAAYRGRLAQNTYWPLYGSSAAYLNVYSLSRGIKLSWTGMTSGTLQVYRAVSKNGKYTKIAELSKGTKTYIDKDAVGGSTNYYYVRMVGSSGKELKRSNKASVYRKRSLTDEKASVTLGYETVKYNGKARKPKVTVKYGTSTLRSSRDYSVSYQNNTKAGTATVTIKGKGNYLGSVTREFTITRIPWKFTVSDEKVRLKVKTWKPSLSVTGLASNVYAKRIKLQSSNKKVAVVSGLKLKLKSAGETKITVTVQGNKNHTKTSKSFILTVKE